MQLKSFEERELRPVSGLLVLFILTVCEIVMTVLFIVGVFYLDQSQEWQSGILINANQELIGGTLLIVSMVGWTVFGLMMAGLKIVQPNEARILLLFGKYLGTISKAGYYYVNPFCVSFSPTYNAAKLAATKKARNMEQSAEIAETKQNFRRTVSLKTQTLNNDRQKVNDVLGNPIIIGAVVIWRVDRPTQAAFSVENYTEYLSIQTDSTIRNVARLYPYDVFDEDEDDGIQEKTLRGSALEIAATMQAELQKRVSEAGLIIDEVRITQLAYAEEIAAAMLQRQQAAAIIAARQKIVDGAVGMVQMAINRLSADNIVLLDEERKAQMVSNLLVVLCGNRDAQPIVNSGSIY